MCLECIPLLSIRSCAGSGCSFFFFHHIHRERLTKLANGTCAFMLSNFRIAPLSRLSLVNLRILQQDLRLSDALAADEVKKGAETRVKVLIELAVAGMKQRGSDKNPSALTQVLVGRCVAYAVHGFVVGARGSGDRDGS